jgi:hypothetical protein
MTAEEPETDLTSGSNSNVRFMVPEEKYKLMTSATVKTGRRKRWQITTLGFFNFH